MTATRPVPRAPLPVVVAGDANVDLVLRGDVVPRFGQAEQLADSGDLVLGGSACIAASGLARLGVPTSLVARVGADTFGAFTLDALRGYGVDVASVETAPDEPTGLSVILSTPADRAILTVPGTIPTLTGARVTQELDARAAHPGILHVASYFLQPGLSAALPGVLARARAQGWTTSLDTNWDPGERWTGLGDVLPHLNLLLPNRNELRAVAGALGEPADLDDTALAVRIARRGPRVVVKDGAAGGWSVGADGDVARAPGLAVDVVDTTGAGDSFDAGYLSAVAHGVPRERERVRWAAVAGSLSTLGAGGTGRQATLDELERVLAP
ncbi:carbohydrate kinase family protein [Myceligenerans indicum]|uniref:Carbohydrate kinase family protein n=1 Tax=Myceligenerans indicum TaxID=2593663 RepID=A0ABS1LH23_9MICO|nr:carbohydrate kinase family protein [Myceligenerans indicum]MBL0885516.1 carbohydrate kinase family protein [Myceligenerans indicum]